MNYVPNTGSHDDLANSTIREEFEVETINLESARVFRQYGGIEVNSKQDKEHTQKKFGQRLKYYLIQLIDFNDEASAPPENNKYKS